MKQQLRIFLIETKIDGKVVSDFEFILGDQRDESRERTEYSLEGDFDFDAKLYVLEPSTNTPVWADFLRDSVVPALELADTVSHSAVLLIHTGGHYFALTFGAGRYMLKPNSIVRRFGLRTALNIIYPRSLKLDSDEFEASRLRDVHTRCVDFNTLNTRRQFSRRAEFERFGVDIDRDFLHAVTGTPTKQAMWGANLSGAHSLSLKIDVAVGDLGMVCRRCLKAYRKTDYKKMGFEWIDHIKPLEDAIMRERLDTQLVASLGSGAVDKIYMSPPGIIEWEDQPQFQFSTEAVGADKHDDLDLDVYLQSIEQNPQARLNIETIKNHQVEMYTDGGPQPRSHWPVYRCVVAELVESGTTYVLYDGQYFSVDRGFYQAMKADLGRIPEFASTLPDSRIDISTEREMTEGVYNEAAAASSPDSLLMDKKTVTMDDRPTPIEVCDIFTTGGDFIHVKRKLSSSSLSHLFNQGTVSAELFRESVAYRLAVRAKLEEAEQDRADTTGDQSFVGKFSGALDAAKDVTPADYTVVYAIVADWGSRSFVEALPFFSMLTLRQQVKSLKRMGYRVAYSQVKAPAKTH